MNANFIAQAPTVVNVAKNAGAAFVIGAAGAGGAVFGLGLGGFVLTKVAKKKLESFYADFKRAK